MNYSSALSRKLGLKLKIILKSSSN